MLDLAHIRKLAGAATDGPWELVGLDDGAGGKLWGAANDVYYNPLNHPEDAPAVAIYVETGSKEDAEFIAAARELVPAMADEIERLRRELEEARAAYELKVQDLARETNRVSILAQALAKDGHGPDGLHAQPCNRHFCRLCYAMRQALTPPDSGEAVRAQ